MLKLVALALAAAASLSPALAARDPADCEVCISALGDIVKGLPAPAPKLELVAIEEAVGKFCEKPGTEKLEKLVSGRGGARGRRRCPSLADPLLRFRPVRAPAPPAPVLLHRPDQAGALDAAQERRARQRRVPEAQEEERGDLRPSYGCAPDQPALPRLPATPQGS